MILIIIDLIDTSVERSLGYNCTLYVLCSAVRVQSYDFVSLLLDVCV